jgi:putative ABC transport system permease protein
MFKNFIKVAIRNITRHKVFSWINVIGLSVGLACSILIALFVFDELSYDTFHERSDDIYRIAMRGTFQGDKLNGVSTGAPVGNIFKEEIPEITNSVRLVNYYSEGATIKIGNNSFKEEDLFYTDSTFFDIFSFELIKGDKSSILTTPYTIVLSESMAEKYYGTVDVVGKSLEIDNEEYMITGVAEDCPANSHFHYKLLASMVSLDVADSPYWLSNDFSYTYLLLDENADYETVNDKIWNVASEHLDSELKDLMGISLEEFKKQSNRVTYYLQPLTSIHLESHSNMEIERNSSKKYVLIFSVIAIFILFIAIINFMNLSTARSATRAKEVGLRKVVGARRGSLFVQFLSESVLMSLLALMIAIVLIETVLPGFNNLAGKNLSLGYTEHWYVLPALILLGILVGIVSGLYTAGYLSRIHVQTVLKGKILSGKSNAGFRNSLVVFQFSISIILFISTIFIYKQLDFILNKDLGYNKEKVFVTKNAERLGESFETFRKKIEKDPKIEAVSSSDALPGSDFNGFPCSATGKDNNDSYVFRSMCANYNLDEVLDLKMIEGEFFSEKHRQDTFTLIVNQAAANKLGYDQPIVGKHVLTSYLGNQIHWKIIGMIKDFNFLSLHKKIRPMVIIHPSLRTNDLLSVKYRSNDEQYVINKVKNSWKEFLPNEPFEYYFLDEKHKTIHKEEFRTGKVFGIFSGLAIFIACLGLFGLASFMAEQKTKEIGIRKAMGAKTNEIVILLLKQFLLWVFVANLVAWPLSYLFMKNWLSNFAYHINISLLYFLIGSVIALLIAVLTVTYQAVTAARNNPVHSLRYE